MAPVKKKKGDKPFILTKAHGQLAKAGICVVTPSAKGGQVSTVLGSKGFRDTVTSYLT